MGWSGDHSEERTPAAAGRSRWKGPPSAPADISTQVWHHTWDAPRVLFASHTILLAVKGARGILCCPAALCYAVPCCSVLFPCCSVLFRVGPFCSVLLFRAVLCCSVFRVAPQYSVWCRSFPTDSTMFHAFCVTPALPAFPRVPGCSTGFRINAPPTGFGRRVRRRSAAAAPPPQQTAMLTAVRGRRDTARHLADTHAGTILPK
eukprot:gene22115-biopygen19222